MKAVERRIYIDTPEYHLYMRARFPGGSWNKNSFEFDGHRWAYRYSSFDDRGEYHLIYRWVDEPEDAKPESIENTVTVRYDLSAVEVEGAIRDKLIEMGWSPPGAEVVFGVDWGVHGDRSCASVVKKMPDGAIHVLATEFAPDPIPRTNDSSENAPWLTEAHALCTDAGIEQGDITSRIRALREVITDAFSWKSLTPDEIEKGRQLTFSTENPFCPCDRKTMLKAVQWADRELRKKNGVLK